MEITTLMILMAFALVILAMVVGVLVLCLFHKNDEIKEKNNVIVREIRRNQELIDRAVHHGINRAAMLSGMMIPLLICAGMFLPCTTVNAVSTQDPFFTNKICINLMKLNFNYDATTDLLKRYPHNFDELTETTELSESGELKLQDVTTFETFYHNALRGI